MGSQQSPRYNNKVVTFYTAHPGDHSWLGHIWIGFQGNGTYGFYPSGIQDDTARAYNLKICFAVEYDKFNRGRDQVESFRTRTYLIDGVCIDLAESIARALQLQIPVRRLTQSPSEWLGDFAIVNPTFRINCS